MSENAVIRRDVGKGTLLQDQLLGALEEAQLSGVSSYRVQMLHNWFGDPKVSSQPAYPNLCA